MLWFRPFSLTNTKAYGYNIKLKNLVLWGEQKIKLMLGWIYMLRGRKVNADNVFKLISIANIIHGIVEKQNTNKGDMHE